MIKIGIVGSRNFYDYQSFKLAIFKILDEWKIKLEDISCIVSGGARGTDKMAEDFADEFSLKKEIYPVTKEDYQRYGKKAPLIRNASIVSSSTHLIAFPSRTGSGTQHSISLAQKIPKKILYID